jgi:tetratricopeptide (TPR) repeat protein
MHQIILVILLLTTKTLFLSGQSLDKLINHPLRAPFDSARTAYENRDFRKAIELYTEVITKTDSSSSFEVNMRKKALIYRSFCKKELKDFEGSIKDMTQAILIDPKDLASYIDRGTTYLEMGELQKAKEDFLKIVETDIKSAQAKGGFYYLGLISHQELKTSESIEYLTKALKIDSEDIDILFTRAYYYGLIRDSENAIKDYDKIIKIDPSIKEVYANRGTEKVNLYNRQEKQDQKLLSSACKDLKRAKDMGDNSVDDLIFIYCK